MPKHVIGRTKQRPAKSQIYGWNWNEGAKGSKAQCCDHSVNGRTSISVQPPALSPVCFMGRKLLITADDCGWRSTIGSHSQAAKHLRPPTGPAAVWTMQYECLILIPGSAASSSFPALCRRAVHVHVHGVNQSNQLTGRPTKATTSRIMLNISEKGPEENRSKKALKSREIQKIAGDVERPSCCSCTHSEWEIL